MDAKLHLTLYTWLLPLLDDDGAGHTKRYCNDFTIHAISYSTKLSFSIAFLFYFCYNVNVTMINSEQLKSLNNCILSVTITNFITNQ